MRFLVRFEWNLIQRAHQLADLIFRNVIYMKTAAAAYDATVSCSGFFCQIAADRLVLVPGYVQHGRGVTGVSVSGQRSPGNRQHSAADMRPASTAKKLPIIKIKAITTRRNPIMQTCIGPSEEHVSMAGIPTEASILVLLEKMYPGKIRNVYCASSGGGKYIAVIQFQKKVPSDEGRQRQAALLVFASFAELKHVFLVDEDVDCFDMEDVLWAMTTRFQADRDLILIPGVQCHPLDPSNQPEYSPLIRAKGNACKAIFDCTVPWGQKDRFVRAKFKEVDPKHWLPDLF